MWDTMSLKGKVSSSNVKMMRTTQRSARNARSEDKRPLKLRSRSSSFEEDSDCGENEPKRQGKCLSRNAIIARNNRIKKKNYIQSLESSLAQYKCENEKMKGTLAMQTTNIQTLRNEIRYLKNVLSNSKEISMLLKTVRDSTGLPTISSLKPASRVKEEPPEYLKKDVDLNSVALPMDDEDFLLPASGSGLEISDLMDDAEDLLRIPDVTNLTCNIGVCLHVAQQRVSLEFCSLCNSKAASAWDIAT